MPDKAGTASGTDSADYSSCYYNEAHLGGYDNYGWDNEEYRAFFQMLADRVIGALNPRTVLDVGCARGLLVQALAERGVDATGLDISVHAIETAHRDVRDRLRVASATEPIDGPLSLITCIEVLEHMSGPDAQAAIDVMCRATDRVLFSSSPGDHDEPTHINTHQTAAWAAWFAERGFHRRTDVDLSFLSPWAVLFERADLTLHSLTQRYETQFTTINTELVDKRAALLEAHRRIGLLHDQLEAQVSPKLGTVEHQLSEAREQVEHWELEVLDARHQLLTTRDYVIGIESQVGELGREVATLTAKLHNAKRRVEVLTGRRDELRDKVKGQRQRIARLRARANASDSRLRELEGRRWRRRLSRAARGGR